MAKLRILKKDIEYLVSEVIGDCYLFMYVNTDKNKQEALDIINEAVALRNNLFERANRPDGKNDKKLVRAHYKSIIKDLLMGVNGLFEKISALTK